ncbi:hypothetical protein ROTAS13_04696 [Roseomonas sp. TAS13]|nr:hypothetical protein ROTAS13_04696 [Roseomonas sp. TAS13]
MKAGSKRFLAYHMMSASTRRPSASVLITSTVWPEAVVTTSPGRCAVPEGMFSTSPTMPIASTLALRPASVAMRPATVPAPAMSHFMSSMPPAGLMEMPPVSKVTPLPTKQSGFAGFFAPVPFQRRITARGSRAEPWATPSSAPKPSLRMSLGPSTSTSRPSFSSFDSRSANSSG